MGSRAPGGSEGFEVSEELRVLKVLGFGVPSGSVVLKTWGL